LHEPVIGLFDFHKPFEFDFDFDLIKSNIT